MTRLRWVALGVALATYAGACGYPTFTFNGTSSSGSGGGTSSTSAVSSSSAASSSSATSASSSSGMAANCRLLHDSEDCQPGERCTVHDESTGKTYCAPLDATPLLPYDACSADADCPQATWCDHHTRVCKPICNGSADCPSTNCTPAKTTGGSIIPGLDVCLAHCDPINLDPCGINTTCEYDKNTGDLDCLRSGEVQPSDPCTYLDDCVGGYVCVGTCEPWCQPADINATVCSPGLCVEFANQLVSYGGNYYGYVCP